MRYITSTTAARHLPHRREFLKVVGGLGLSLAGMTLLNACGAKPAAPETEGDTLETTTIRLVSSAAVCVAPQYLAEDILKSDGFTEVQYVPEAIGPVKSVASGAADLAMTFSGPLVLQVDAGDPIVIVAGIHVGCFELFGTEQIQSIGDLKGKTVAVRLLGSSQHIFLASMLAYVNIDPNKDITWVTHPSAEAIQLLADGKVDAYMAFPPEPQVLRAKKIGHVVVSSMMDKPWSQYFCCMVAANREFTRKNPVATKRALRALLKATDLCAREPERAAQLMVDKGYIENYDYALATMQSIHYNYWRKYDPEDTLRFYALRLREAGMIQSNPDGIIKQYTNWQFLNELKAELGDQPALLCPVPQRARRA